MIKIKHIDGVISEKDSKLIPKDFIGRHSNGNEWIYFETKDEKDKYFIENPLPTSEGMVEKSPLMELLNNISKEELELLKTMLK